MIIQLHIYLSKSYQMYSTVEINHSSKVLLKHVLRTMMILQAKTMINSKT